MNLRIVKRDTAIVVGYVIGKTLKDGKKYLVLRKSAYSKPFLFECSQENDRAHQIQEMSAVLKGGRA